jgi:AAA ATPase domain
VLFPLVARAGVLAEVGSVLASARAGRGALVMVTGEPGIGKTRLAEALADWAQAGQRIVGQDHADQARAFEVVWTWCPAAAGGAPLRPWARVVRMLAAGHAEQGRAFPHPDQAVAAARRGDWLDRLLPRLAAEPGDHAPVTGPEEVLS